MESTTPMLQRGVPDDGHRFLVQHLRGSSGADEEHYVSILSPKDLIHHKTLSLYFCHRNANIYGSSCGGLVYFDDFEGNTVVGNPTTEEIKFLPRPQRDNSSPTQRMIVFEASGFGIGRRSSDDDYKIVRIFAYSYYDKEDGDEFTTYKGSNPMVEVYPLKRESSEVFECPEVAEVVLSFKSCAYVSGTYYWVTGLSPDYSILSFDFGDETFSTLPLPSHESLTSDCNYDLFELDGKLAAVGYERLEASRTNTFVVWTLEEGSWKGITRLDLDNVVRPMLLTSSLYYFEGNSSDDKLSQLFVYDVNTKKLDGLDIYDYPQIMRIIPYVESTDPLPNAEPWHRIDSDDEGYVSDEDTKDKVPGDDSSDDEGWMYVNDVEEL